MKKAVAATTALMSFFATLTGVAHATQGSPSSAYPQIVDSVVGVCKAQEAAKGRCKKGQPVLRVTARVPECWSLRQSSTKGGVAFAYVMTSQQGCVTTGAAPRLKRYVVAL